MEFGFVLAEGGLVEHVRVVVILLERDEGVGELLCVLLPVVTDEVRVEVEVVLVDNPVAGQALDDLDAGGGDVAAVGVILWRREGGREGGREGKWVKIRYQKDSRLSSPSLTPSLPA